MESLQDNNKRVFDCFYQWSLSISDSHRYHPIKNKTKLRVLNFKKIATETNRTFRKSLYFLRKKSNVYVIFCSKSFELSTMDNKGVSFNFQISTYCRVIHKNLHDYSTIL